MKVSRTACVHLPDLPLVALVRADPTRRGRPLAVVESLGPSARLLVSSEAARASQVLPGMGVAAARRLLPELEVLPRDPEQERQTLEELEAVAGSYSPTLAASPPETLYLDATGVRGLFGGELAFGQSLRQALAARRLPARVGIAGTQSGAYGAACWEAFLRPGRPPPARSFQREGAVTRVLPGQEAEFLALLSLSLFAPDEKHLALLLELGVRSCGALARLAPTSVEERLGPEGLDLQERCRGRDPCPEVPTPRPPPHRAHLELEEPLTTQGALEAALEHLLERLLPPLVEEGLAVDVARVSLTLASGAVDLRVLHTAAPARELRPLRELLTRKLHTPPPEAPVQEIELELRPARIRPVQLSLFLPAGPSPRALVRTVSRVEGLVGSDRVGTPAELDDHRPAAFTLGRFRPPSPRPPRGDPPPPGCPVRSLRPPHALRVRTRGQRPHQVSRLPPGFPVGSLEVLRAAGPWPLSGAWWGERPYQRLYWDLEVEGPLVLRVFQDLRRGRWWLDGFQD